MKKWFSISLLLIHSGLSVFAQTPATHSSADIYLQLKKLNVLGSVLYIAAHPDDENTRLLAYLAQEKMYRTGYLSITRGDGGQNLIGDEQGIELGLIRTQELLAARRIDGAEQFFTRAYDFGYSKSATETMHIWDKERVLSDVVWVIRKFQPDIIITRFPADERAGHGHHTASAILAGEAYTAAADPSRFPEQMKHGVRPWQAKRILWNTFNFGRLNTTDEHQFRVDVGSYNNLLGKGYSEIASESRSQHKSQGFGVARQRGQQIEFFTPINGTPPKDDLLDGVTTGWPRVKGGEEIKRQVDHILQNFSFEKPQLSVPALLNLYRSIQQMEPGYWTNKKLQEVQQLIEACSGLFSEAVTNQEYGVLGDTVKLNLVLVNRNGVDAKLNKVEILSAKDVLEEKRQQLLGNKQVAKKQDETNIARELTYNQSILIPHAIPLHHQAPVSQPYWLQQGLSDGYFNVADQMLVGQAENFPAYSVRFHITLHGLHLAVDRPVQYKYTDPVKGEIYQPLAIVPKVIVSALPKVALTNVTPPTQPVIKVNYTSNVQAANVPATLKLHNGITHALVDNEPLNFRKGETKTFSYPIHKYYTKGKTNSFTHTLQTDPNGRQEQFNTYHRSIHYDHIPAIHYFYSDTVKLIDKEIKTVGKRVGYIAGAGDRVAEMLELMGYEVILLKETDIYAANLKQFDAIITGVRAYNIHDYLGNMYNQLMQYVHNGGNLIVQYNTNNQLGPVRARMAPYPFTITRTRITNERSPVTFTLPHHPALNFPNKITQADFEGWIQERSIYHAGDVDDKYAMPIAMHDEGEQPNSGNLIIAPYGKGNFVYTGLAFFRQMPAGVPGAFRLMANLLALPKHEINQQQEKPQ